MIAQYLQEGKTLTWFNSTGATVANKTPVLFGLWCMAIVLSDVLNAAYAEAMVNGVWTITKTTGAIAQGGAVWWDATNAYCINAPAKNSYFLGYATEAAASDATTVNVKLEEFKNEGTRVLTLTATGNETLNVGDFASGDLILFAPNTAAKTINLPSVATIPVGAKLTVRKTTADAFAITLDPASSEEIAGGSTHATIDANNDWAQFVNTGSAWALVNAIIA